MIRTAVDTSTARSLTGEANRLVWTNADGVSGPPTVSIGSDIATLAGSQTFTGQKTFVGPILGAATATSINKVAFTAPATSATVTVANGKTVTVNNTVTLSGTDGSTLAFGAGGTVAYTGATQTLTATRLTKRVIALTDAATITPNADTMDMGTLASLSQTTNFANPSGTPTDGQLLILRIKSVTARAVTWGTQYRGGDTPLPTTTQGANKTEYWGFIRHAADSKWDHMQLGGGFQ